MFKKIIVPYDGSKYSDKALSLAIDMVQENGGAIALCTVLPAPVVTLQTALPDSAFEPPKTTKAFEKATRKLKKSKVDFEAKILQGDVSEEILKFTKKEKGNIIVMGSRGLSSFSELLIGSNSSKIVKLAKVPVLVTKL